MLTLEGITKSFGETAALQGIEVEIAEGEFFSIVGPSGCGKSTLLRIVAGLERPDGGRVCLENADVTTWEPTERGIGMGFQNYALFPHLSAGANIGFGLKGRVPKKELARRVQEIAELLEFDETVLKRRPRQLSGGQRQRIALGRALIRQPRVLLMDEPLSSADALLRERMRSELRRFHERAGTTTLYVTHDQREAMSMSDRLMVLDHGRVQQVGRPIEVYRRPRTEFAARFLGAPGMNVWSMAVQEESGGLVLLARDGDAWPLRTPAPQGTASVLVGIRPEQIALGPRSPADVRLRCTIGAIEPLGEQALIHAWYGDTEIVATIGNGGEERLGKDVDFWLTPSELHLFSAETGERIESEETPLAKIAARDEAGVRS